MGNLDSNAGRLAEDLINESFVVFGRNEPTSAEKSKTVVRANIRDTISSPNLLGRIASAYAIALQGTGFLRHQGDAVQLMAATEAQSPYAAIIANRFHLGMLSSRSGHSEKSFSTTGRFKQGDEVLLLNGVLQPGGGIVRTVRNWQKKGLRVAGVVSLIDRQLGGMTELADIGVPSEAALTISGIASHAYEKEMIDEPTFQRVIDELTGRTETETHAGH